MKSETIHFFKYLKTEKFSETFFLAAFFVLPFSKAGFEIFAVIASVSWLFLKLINGWQFSDKVLPLICALFLGLALISAFNSGYPERSLRGSVKLIKHIFIILIAADLFQDPNKMKHLIYVGLTSYVIVLIDSAAQWITGRDLVRDWTTQFANNKLRLTGPYQSYGLLGSHIISILPILITSFFQSPKNRRINWNKIGLAFLTMLSFGILYQTHSRGAWIASLASLIFLSILIRNKWIFVTLASLILAAFFLLPRHVLVHMDLYHQEQSVLERNLLWSRAVQVIRARPFFGCGINTFVQNYPQYVKDNQNWRLFGKETLRDDYVNYGEKESWRIPGHHTQIPDYSAHNGYLQLAAESGLIAFGLFLILVGWCLKSSYVAFKNSTGVRRLFILGVLTGAVALLFQAFVDSTMQALQSAAFIWLYLGLLVAISKQQLSNQ